MSDSTFDHRGWPDRWMSGTVSRLRWRVVATIAGAVTWISFTLLFVAFWAHGFSIFQSIVVIFVSLLVLGGTLAALWVSFGLRYHDLWD
jgi:hypothetical protein